MLAERQKEILAARHSNWRRHADSGNSVGDR
jgi:hypothetical protein